jgi:hypothetical protein
MTHPDFRALCAELLGALADQWVGDERPDPDVVIRARAALATPEPLPLWRVIAVAGISGPCNQRDIIAAEIKALRDWLLPSESAVISDSAPDDPIWARFNERQRLRSLLTEQARIARGEND